MEHRKIGITKLVITGVSVFILLSGIGLVAASNDALSSSDEKSPLFTYRTDSVFGTPTNVKVDYVDIEKTSAENEAAPITNEAGGSPNGGLEMSILTWIFSCDVACHEPPSVSWDCPGGCIHVPGPRPARTVGCSTNEVECDTFGEINCPSE
jgi:hypothetical protein